MSRGPLSLFHAAAEREKEEAAKREHHVAMIKQGQVNIYEVEQKLNKGAGTMLEQAVAKLKAEMDADKKNPYLQLIGQHMIDYVTANPGAAEHVMGEKKTIKGSLDAMQAEARKKAVNGCAMLTDAEGFAIVYKYFGVKGSAAVVKPTAPPIEPVEAEQAKPVETIEKKARFVASLDDFL